MAEEEGDTTMSKAAINEQTKKYRSKRATYRTKITKLIQAGERLGSEDPTKVKATELAVKLTAIKNSS